MIYFNCDYSEGAHPKILEKLEDTNFIQTPGYGEDIYCQKAAKQIKRHCKREDIDIYFFVGGTQTNLTFLGGVLRPHQGIIAAKTGHIFVHETGAIEATGHKILALPEKDGKISAKQIEELCQNHIRDKDFIHTVQPKLVYLSNPTEVGTIYTKQELSDISYICKKYHLFLYLDGARLGYGLCAKENDLSLYDISNLCDAFYIGGTKVGALFGEALIITTQDLKADFLYLIKQRGALLAKGRLLGIQFLTLFENNLYFEIASHAVDMAIQIKNACRQKGYSFLVDSPTNQQFPILPNEKIAQLEKEFCFSYWEKINSTHTAIRICTSWATTKNQVSKLIEKLIN